MDLPDGLGREYDRQHTLAQRIELARVVGLFHARPDDEEDAAGQATAAVIAREAVTLWSAPGFEQEGIARVRLAYPIHQHQFDLFTRELELLDASPRLMEIVRRAMPRWRWADQYPDACQELLDPSIRVANPSFFNQRETPCGWVPLINSLHAEITEKIGAHAVQCASQKFGRLRYSAVFDVSLSYEQAALYKLLLEEAHEKSYGLCEVCGGRVQQRSITLTRCSLHPFGTTPHVHARPPGWRP
ncbi:MAG: hypothetical protein QM658_03345 [Gordonia sp. (in: high G+C Gram-positive bacteria)]